MTEQQTQESLNNEAFKANKSQVNADTKKYRRLPCRGCLASCKNYELCDGKLWRMAQ